MHILPLICPICGNKWSQKVVREMQGVSCPACGRAISREMLARLVEGFTGGRTSGQQPRHGEPLQADSFGPEDNPNRQVGPVIFYDGNCGLCHRMVRLVLAADREGVFLFSPLEGEFIRQELSSQTLSGLPDTIVLMKSRGEVLFRSDAVVQILMILGGAWKMVGWLALMIPGFLRDRIYDGVAAIRYRLFGRTIEQCPLVPCHLRKRFRH